MVDLRDKKTGEITRTYKCTPDVCTEYCYANIECLLQIALADSDKHIKELGGERELLVLMNGYLDLVERLQQSKIVKVKNAERVD